MRNVMMWWNWYGIIGVVVVVDVVRGEFESSWRMNVMIKMLMLLLMM
jgi:hypothetical protein